MDKSQANLKAARAKIEAVLKEHDIAGFVSLHGTDWGEVFWNIWPSYSILKGDFPHIRIVSHLADYGGDHSKQVYAHGQTAQMVSSEADRQETQRFALQSILIGHCNERLDPDLIDKITLEMVEEMRRGATSWAFNVRRER